MKKIMILMLSAASLLTLTGCVNKKDEPIDEPIVVEQDAYDREVNLPDPYPMATEQPSDLPYNEDESKHLAIAQKYPTLDIDNVFFESNEEEIKELMNGGSGVVYFATSQDDWSQFLIYEVNLACRAVGVDVNLYDLTPHLEAQDEFVTKLKSYLSFGKDETLKQPLAMFILNGELVGYYSPDVDMKETSPEDYYDADKTIEVEDQLYNLALQINK